MRNTAPFFLLPFILVLVISLLPAEEQAPASVHPAQLLPDGASFVVEVPSAPELGRQMLKTGFGRLAVDPVLKPLIEWARLVVFKMHPGAGNVEPAIYSTLKMMKGSVVAAFYPGDGTRGSGSLVLAFETKAPHAETAELVTNILKLLSLPVSSVPDAYGQSMTWSLSRYHRITVERGNVVLILNPEPLEKVWGTHLGRPSLADSAARAMAREKLRQNALLYSYIPSHGGKVLRPLMNRDIIEALELDQADMLMTQTWVDAGLVHEEAWLFYREKPMRLLGLISEPAPITGADIAPYHSAAWAHLSLDWSKERAAMARLGVLLDGDLTDLNIDFDPEDFVVETGIPIGKKLEESLSGGATLFCTLSEYSVIPYIHARVPLKDPEPLTVLFDAMAEFDPDSFGRSDRRGLVMWYTRPDYPTLLIPTVSIREKEMLISNGVPGLRELLAIPDDAPKLNTHEMFLKLSSRVSGVGNQFVFINLRKLTEKYLPLFRMIQRFDADLGVPRLPTYHELEPYITGQFVVQTVSGNDIVVESVGDVPMLSLLMGIVPTGLSGWLLPKSVFDPNELRVQNNITSLNCREHVEKIWALLDAWAKEHDGEYPPLLDDIAGADLGIFQCPATQSPIDVKDVNGTSDYFYFTGLSRMKPDDEGGAYILLADRLSHPGKGRTVLYSDGRIQMNVDDRPVEWAIKRYNEKHGAAVLFEGGVIY